jgi:hypothetical protein
MSSSQAYYPAPGPCGRAKLLNGARLVSAEPFTFETSAVQWAFALSVPLGSLPRQPPGDEVLIDVEVLRGAIGVGPIASEDWWRMVNVGRATRD